MTSHREAATDQSPIMRVFTFITDTESYFEMMESFRNAGFTGDRATFIALQSKRGFPEPYSTISKLVASLQEPYFILCHQDVRLDQGHGFEDLALGDGQP